VTLCRILVVVGASAACHTTTDPSGDPDVGSAIVYGRVTTANGTPVSQALLHARVYLTCAVQNDSTWIGSGRDNVAVSPDGSYRDIVHGTATASYCVVVTVDSVPAMGLSTMTTAGTMAPFRFVNGSTPDSVRIDIVMQ
jgi:hypothetical protein